MFDSNEELSVVACEIYGIVFTYTAVPHEIKPKIEEFQKHIEKPQNEKQCNASLRVIGCFAERGLFQKTRGLPLSLVENIGTIIPLICEYLLGIFIISSVFYLIFS